MRQIELIAACAFGLETLVKFELIDLGYAPQVIAPGRVSFTSDPRAIARANYWLRTADRILIRLAQFETLDFGVLFDGVFAVPWEEWIPQVGNFPVRGRSRQSQLSSVPACQKIVKKAVVERLRKGHGCEELPETGALYALEIEMLNNMASVYLDTTGPSLHKRGYRTYNVAAPLKETLAAAMIILSRWNYERPLIDPFCGSGVIPLEAALIGRNIAPGSLREFPSEEWTNVEEIAWIEAFTEAEDLAQRNRPLNITGSDIDPHVLHLAGRHREQAGVKKGVRWIEQDFSELEFDGEYGCIVSNPPYGERLSELREVEDLYRSFPKVLRKAPTWSHYFLCAHSEFEQLVGQTASKRRKLYNGRIECTFYQFFGPKPPFAKIRDEAIKAARLPEELIHEEGGAGVKLATIVKSQTPQQAFGGLDATSLRQIELFRTRLAKRAHHLRRWPTKLGITCYRLYDRDVPEIPLAVDIYENWLHISEYDRPHERTAAQHADWLDAMGQTAAEVMNVPPEQVFIKHRRRQRGAAQYDRVADETQEIMVQEGGLKFLVNLSDYLDTGLFLDHRQTRGMVRTASQNKRVLNLFCYTGSFSVYAAAGGAASTTSVDLSQTYLDWARKNFSINNLLDPRHKFIRHDCLAYMQELPREALFDLAIVDAPTFSNSKRLEEDWDVQGLHVKLLKETALRMRPGSLIYFSTNFRRFKPNWEMLPELKPWEISRQTVPEDYRNERIHRCWKCTVV